MCLFHKNDKPCVEIRVGTQIVKSKKFINVLGVTFDSKLNWSTQVLNCISKAKKSLYALWLLKRYFSPQHMRTLLDSYFYSVLYYNAKVWLTPGLSANSKQLLLSASANALRSCVLCNSNEISFLNVHKINKKCTPDQIMLYQIAIELHKTINNYPDLPSTNTVRILDQIVCTRRQNLF